METKPEMNTGARDMVSPLTGARCPTGAHPKNTGGKKGRSGRRPDVARRLARQGTEHAMRVLGAMVLGNAIVERRGKDGSGKDGSGWHWEPVSEAARLTAASEVIKADMRFRADDILRRNRNYIRRLAAVVIAHGSAHRRPPNEVHELLERMDEVDW